MAEQITEAELLDALAAAMPGRGPAHARTVDELRRATRLSKVRILNALHELQSQGRLAVHRVMRPRLDGQMNPVPGYEVLPPMKKSSRLARRRG